MQRPPPGAMSAVLSAAGFGLMLWLGVSVALLPPGTGMAALRAPQMWALILAVALVATAGALAIACRGGRSRPGPARGAGMWHRRRNLLATIALILAVATGVLLTPGPDASARALGLGFTGMSLAAASLGAITAGAFADLLPSPPSALPPLAVPSRLLAALLTGLALMFALLSGLLAVGDGGSRMLGILLLLGALAALTQWLDRRQAAGEGRPVVASGRSLLSGLLLAGVPALALGLAAAGLGSPTAWLWAVALAAVAGSLAGWWSPPQGPASRP